VSEQGCADDDTTSRRSGRAKLCAEGLLPATRCEERNPPPKLEVAAIVVTRRSAEIEEAPFLCDCFLRSMRESISKSRGYWDEARERAQFEEQLDLGATEIVQNEGVDVGFLTLARRQGVVQIHTLCVAPEHQGRGLGSEIVRQVIAEAFLAGQVVVLSVLKSNGRAQAFYERLEFRVVDESEHHRHLRYGCS
jgi:ribosomal protein S18 acetylase RimI-like enzyme